MPRWAGPAARSRPRGRPRGRGPRSPPSWTASSAAIIQSAQAWPGATSFWPSRVIRPSMLVVVPVRSWARPPGRTTSATAVDGVRERGDGDDKPALSRARRPGPGRGSRRGDRPPGGRAHRGRPASSAAARSMPAVSQPASCRHRSPGLRRTSPGRHRGRPVPEAARGRGPCRGPLHVPPAQGREEAGPGSAAASVWTRLGHQRAVLGQRRAPTMTTTFVGRQQPAGLGQPASRRRRPRGGVAPSADHEPQRPGRRPRPGRYRRDARRIGGERASARGESSTTSRSAVDHGGPQAEEEDGQLLAEVARTARPPCRPQAAWSMVARGRPSTTSAGRPSPSWASTESVPRTPLANLAQA